jgi:RNA polymerase sigma-70 factor, ECF subfamily
MISDRLADASDTLLVLAIARFDHDALAAAYRRHAGAVFGLAKRLLVEPALAEEIVQDVFLRLWNDPSRFDPERGTLRSYLLTQTHGRAVDMLRADSSRRQRENRDAQRTASVALDPERDVWELMTAEHVRRSLLTLPTDERMAIELAYYGGYTYREVATRLDQPEGTVKSRIRNGLKRLRGHLAEAGIGGA